MELEKNQRGLILIEVTGFSMWPFIRAGEKLIIKISPLSELRIGDIILYHKDDQKVCHRLVKKIKKNNGYDLFVRGDNSISLPELITEQMFLGKVIGVLRNNKIINLNSLRQRFINQIIIIIAPFINLGVKISKHYLGNDE